MVESGLPHSASPKLKRKHGKAKIVHYSFGGPSVPINTRLFHNFSLLVSMWELRKRALDVYTKKGIKLDACHLRPEWQQWEWSPVEDWGHQCLQHLIN